MAEVRWVVVSTFLLGDNNRERVLTYPCTHVQYKSLVPLSFWRATNGDPDQAIL